MYGGYKVGMFSSFLMVCFTLLVVNSSEAWRSSTEKNIHPVIFVPGLGGSQIRAKFDGKTSSPGYLCWKNSHGYEFTIWLNLASILKLVKFPFLPNVFGKCLADNLRLVYNNATRTTSNVQGVSLWVPDFGYPSSVEVLYPNEDLFDKFRRIPIIRSLADPYFRHRGELFRDIRLALETIGLKRNVSIRGAPYDFRKAPNEHKDYFLKLKTLVEETYRRNGNSSVVLLAHSLGGPMTLQFLRQQTQEWKDKFIKSLISLAASWGGSVKPIMAYIEGYNLDISLFSGELLKRVLTTMPSIVWMMPSHQFWGKDEVLVSTPKRNYTINNMKEFFHDVGQPTAWEMYKDVLKYTSDMDPPGVEVHCLYGTKVDSTIEQLRYDGDFNHYKTASHLKGYGDGTVNLRSLKGCLRWRTLQKKKVYHKELANLGHLAILSNKGVIKYIESVVRGEK